MSTPTPPDPYRIKRILNKLERVWETRPDLALTETLWNIGLDGDYQSDDTAEKALDIRLKDHSLSGWKS
jgi:uncharacterized protein YihD (DUF1040 family)